MPEREGGEVPAELERVLYRVDDPKGHHVPLTCLGKILSNPVRRDLLDFFLSSAVQGDRNPCSVEVIADRIGAVCESVRRNIQLLVSVEIVTQCVDRGSYLFTPQVEERTFTMLMACAGGLREICLQRSGDSPDIAEDKTSLNYLFEVSSRRRICEFSLWVALLEAELDPLNKTELEDVVGVSRRLLSDHLPVLSDFCIIETVNNQGITRYRPVIHSPSLRLLIETEKEIQQRLDKSDYAAGVEFG